jgi:hypothetical protein
MDCDAKHVSQKKRGRVNQSSAYPMLSLRTFRINRIKDGAAVKFQTVKGNVPEKPVPAGTKKPGCIKLENLPLAICIFTQPCLTT